MKQPQSIAGFTLIEMIITIVIAGILTGLTGASLLSLNKPLKTGTNAFKAQLELIRTKAVSSNKAFRIRPKYPVLANYKGERYQQTAHNFIVEFSPSCLTTTYAGSGTVGSNGWYRANQYDIDLPEEIGVSYLASQTPTVNGTPVTNTTRDYPIDGTATTSTETTDPQLNWEICYDNQGIGYQAVTLSFKDYQANNPAKFSKVIFGAIGGIDIQTYDATPSLLPIDPQGNPVY